MKSIVDYPSHHILLDTINSIKHRPHYGFIADTILKLDIIYRAGDMILVEDGNDLVIKCSLPGHLSGSNGINSKRVYQTTGTFIGITTSIRIIYPYRCHSIGFNRRLLYTLMKEKRASGSES